MLALTLSLALTAAPPQEGAREAAPVHRLAIADLTGLTRRRIAALDLDFVAHGPTRGGPSEIVATDADLDRLEAAGIPHRVLVDDLSAYYRSRFEPSANLGPPTHGAWLSPPFASGSMGGYYTFAQVVSVLDQITAAYPGIVTAKSSLGTSIQGRDLWMIKVSDNPGVDESEPEMRIDSLHHAREAESLHATLWFILWLVESYGTDPLATYLVDNREIYYVPVVNPDGYVYNQSTDPGGGGLWRKNRRNNGGGSFGVDLNRNYPFQWGFDDLGSSPDPSSNTYRGTTPQSEPEVAAMVAFISSRDFKTALSVHTYSNLWLSPYGYAELLPINALQYNELGALATLVNGYVFGGAALVLYSANGVTVDYDHSQGTLAWTPELGSSSDGFWPPTSRIVPLAQENLFAIQVTALAAGAYVRDAGLAWSDSDADGYYEPGENVELVATCRNSGREASGPVEVRLVSASPFVSIVNGTAALGAIPPFAQAANGGAPLELAISPSAPEGGVASVSVKVEHDGYVQTLDVELPLGEERLLVLEDFEQASGWTVGAAGDTASTGVWERADPIGTDSSGAPVNPSDDTTPAPGALCYVTGNGGGSAGNDDVDGGATTLLSPPFDLSGTDEAQLSYSRWFANLGNADDDFPASVSNDGGQSWSPLETVLSNENSWQQVAFDLAAILPLTDDMRLRFVASDDGAGSLVEAAIDDLAVRTFGGRPVLGRWGATTLGATVDLLVAASPGARFDVHSSPVGPDATTTPATDAAVSKTAVASGVVPAGGLARLPLTLPSDAGQLGVTTWYQVRSGGKVSRWIAVTPE